MKYKVPEPLKKLLRSPYTSIFTGVILFASGVFESTETALEKFFDIEIKSYMGIIFFAIVQILKAITDIFEGLEKFEVAGLTEEETHL
ncbi:hypothetical protein [Desulforegula conservatrix]|uniref:hypothetical protein n=1 Tax=Desulforegula conservatrix TaxID=153026 RepID=UPI000415F31F|nr:hypothetical protein [Desulforegula conservatrix]